MKLTIEKMVYGGNGLAHRSDGTTVFVPFTLPGETLEANIVETRSHYNEARIDEVSAPSPDRVAPRCVHFGACGGCHYQHAAYGAQLQMKQAILQETLERAGLKSLPTVEAHAAEPWDYRNRIRLRVSQLDEKYHVGYLRRGSTEFLPVQMCPIAAPVLWRSAEAFLHLEKSFPLWIQATEEIEFFSNGDEQKIQMMLFVRTQPAKGFAALCEALQHQIPLLAGAGVQIIEPAGHGRKSMRVRAGVRWGDAGLTYTVADETYWVSGGSFFQVNRFILPKLVDLVTSQCSGKLAWDLYAGVGLFSRILKKHFSEVVAVEAADGNLATNFHGKGKRAIAATTVEFLRQAILERDRPDLIVMDPPRAGLGPEVCTLLMRLKPSQMIYVSCDPSTLGRDLRIMVDSGYRLNQLHLVDMFPQTFHQETVAVLGP